MDNTLNRFDVLFACFTISDQTVHCEVPTTSIDLVKKCHTALLRRFPASKFPDEKVFASRSLLAKNCISVVNRFWDRLGCLQQLQLWYVLKYNGDLRRFHWHLRIRSDLWNIWHTSQKQLWTCKSSLGNGSKIKGVFKSQRSHCYSLSLLRFVEYQQINALTIHQRLSFPQ